MKVLAIALLCSVGLNAALAQGSGLIPSASFKITLGIAETGGTGPPFSYAGGSPNIEWVNFDGQTIVADGTWHLFTFTPSLDPLTNFAGILGNGVLDTDWGALDHLRIVNSSGVGLPVRMWIDDVANTGSAGSAVEDFESFAVGSQVIFNDPGYSGSTSHHLVSEPNSSAVTDSTGWSGAHSDELNFQFVDGDPTRWLRLITSGAANLGRPAMLLREPDFNPTISFYAKAIVVPEPSTAAIIGLGLLAVAARRRRK